MPSIVILAEPPLWNVVSAAAVLEVPVTEREPDVIPKKRILLAEIASGNCKANRFKQG